MTISTLHLLRALLCADAPALDSAYSRLLQAKDDTIRQALEQLAADLAERLVSEDERSSSALLLVAFFAQFYRHGATTVSRLPTPIGGIWLDWWYRGQHALGEGPHLRDSTVLVKAPAGEVAVHFRIVSAQAAVSTRGVLLPLPESVQYDAGRLRATLPFAYRVPCDEERDRWGSGLAAQQRGALQELIPRCAEALAEVKLPLQQLLKHARSFVSTQWGDRFLPVDLATLLEARLGGYLRECLDLSSVGQEDGAAQLEGRLRVYQGVRESAGPLMKVLGEVAEPERRLFEKRPFVVRTEWLVPVMDVARPLWPTIRANNAQLSAWRTLFALSGQVDEGVLERHPTLVVDTSHFDDAFKQALLESLPDRDAALSGILIRAENYRALRFLEPTYRQKIRCIVIDPPYDTGNRDYPYRDSFDDCSWMTMMEERLLLAWQLLDEDGALFVHIDDHHMADLGCLLDELCGEENRVATVVWHRTYGGHSDAKHVSVVHEYILVYARNPARFHAGEGGREPFTHGVWGYEEVGSTATGTKELRSILRYDEVEAVFPTVKPTPLIRRMLRLATTTSEHCAILDFFAGSGSLAHSVIEQNRADGGNRRFLLVEQSRHFDVTILPRVMRAMYCPGWKEGRPAQYPEPGLWWPTWVEHTPRLVKVVRLEGYEESLENLVVGEAPPPHEVTPHRHALRYRVALPFDEMVGLLQDEQFAHPFTSTLMLHSDRGICPFTVDLVETANALLGLHVEGTRCEVNPQTGRQYTAVFGRLGERRVLVLWSECPEGNEGERSFLLECGATYDLVLTNDPGGAEGRASLVPLLRKSIEASSMTNPTGS